MSQDSKRSRNEDHGALATIKPVSVFSYMLGDFGCNLAFSLAMPVMAGSGEAVMLPTPWYFNHRMALEIAGIGAVPLPCAAADGFVPDPDRAAALLEANPQVRALVLITPNNPTGAIIPPETLARFAALCRARLDHHFLRLRPPPERQSHDPSQSRQRRPDHP